MRVLALDVGDERIGVAISDPSRVLARPLEIIPRVAGPASYLRLKEIIAAEGVGEIVVGLPLLLDGGEGKQVASTRAYVRGLRRHVSLPIRYWDERLTTAEARERVAEGGSRRRRRGEPIDDVAAAVILQDYLDHASEDPARA